MEYLNVPQIRVIVRDYKNSTAKEIANRTGAKSKTIHACAIRLGLKKTPNWTQKEINFLTLLGAKVASMYLNRSFNSCKIKYSRWKNTKLIN